MRVISCGQRRLNCYFVQELGRGLTTNIYEQNACRPHSVLSRFGPIQASIQGAEFVAEPSLAGVCEVTRRAFDRIC